MRLMEDLTGAVIQSIREYDIAPETAVVVGQVVKLAEGRVVPALAGETGAILGYAAESHSGKEEALNERANGRRILVQDSPTAVVGCAAPVVVASGGTETTVTVADAPDFAGGLFAGGYVKDAAGQVRRVTGSEVSGGTLTLTVEPGEVPEAGEAFAVFPPVGFVGGNLSAEGTMLVLTANAALPLQVVGRVEDTNTVKLAATKHLLAVTR